MIRIAHPLWNILKHTHPDKKYNLGKIISSLLVFVFIVVMGWRSINYVSGSRFDVDAGAFSGSALLLTKGKVLYKEVWDHKPPGVHFLNSIALMIGDRNIDSIRMMEKYFGVLGSVIIFFISYLIFRTLFFSALTVVLFQLHFYHNAIFQGGNLTEEYAAIFMMGGVISVLIARNLCVKRKYIHGFSFMAGFLFSLAAFTKEPFILASFPWLLYLILKNLREWKSAIFRGLYFIIGSMIPFLVILLYLVKNDAVKDWLDVISFNILNSKASRAGETINLLECFYRNLGYSTDVVFQRTIICPIFFCASIFGICHKTFLNKYNHLPLVMLFSFVMNYWGSLISARHIGHYYMQIVPDFVMLSIFGIAFLNYILLRVGFRKILIVLFIVFLLFIFDYNHFQEYVWRQKRPFINTPEDELATVIREYSKTDDPIWISNGYLTWILIEADRDSPSKYFFTLDHFFIDTRYSTREEKIESVKKGLYSTFPKFIIIHKTQPISPDDKDIEKWMEANYSLIRCNPIDSCLYALKTPQNEPLLKNPKFDYSGDYSAKAFEGVNMRDSVKKRRRQIREVIFQNCKEAAQSLEAIEAEAYENKTRHNHIEQCKMASGGMMVGRDFGSRDTDQIEYTIYLESPLGKNRLSILYATKIEGALYEIFIDGKILGSINLPVTGDWGDLKGFQKVHIDLPALSAGFHNLCIRSNGKAVNFDAMWFE
jgi:hypothetical protein